MSDEITMSRLTGRARPAPALEESPEGDQLQDEPGEEIVSQDENSELESGEEDDGSPDASENEDTGDENDQPAGKSAGKSDSEELVSLRKELADLEKKRANWQSRASASESDLTKALDLVKNAIGQSDNGASNGAGDEVTLEGLGIDRETVMDPDALDKIVNHINSQRAADTQIATNNNHVAGINAATEKHKDIDEIASYFNENNMGNRDEAFYLNNLGRYHFAKAEKLEGEVKQLKADHKIELAKISKQRQQRQKRNDDIPSMPSGSAPRQTPRSKLGVTAQMLLDRQKARSQRS